MNSVRPVMIGGAIGAGVRHLVGQAMLARLGPGFPWWTLTINIVGSLLMGLLIGALARGDGISDTVRLFVGVGILRLQRPENVLRNPQHVFDRHV